MVRVALLCQAQMQQGSPACQTPPGVFPAPALDAPLPVCSPKGGGAPKLGGHLKFSGNYQELSLSSPPHSQATASLVEL